MYLLGRFVYVLDEQKQNGSERLQAAIHPSVLALSETGAV